MTSSSEAPRSLRPLFAVLNDCSTGLPRVVSCQALRHPATTKGADAMYQLIDCPESLRAAWCYQEYISYTQVCHSELSAVEDALIETRRAVGGAEVVLGNAKALEGRLKSLHTAIDLKAWARTQRASEALEALEGPEAMCICRVHGLRPGEAHLSSCRAPRWSEELEGPQDPEAAEAAAMDLSPIEPEPTEQAQ